MKKNIILDTGPLVAFLNKRDKYHEWSKEILDTIEPPLITCESVISEACFLVKNLQNGQEQIIDLLFNDLIIIAFSLREEKVEIKNIIKKYSNIPISLADACLIRMSEKYPDSKVLTLDSDFKIYRKNNRQIIPCILPLSGTR
ncbi:hypothetical protein ES703_04290 [subsurface metagenome]